MRYAFGVAARRWSGSVFPRVGASAREQPNVTSSVGDRGGWLDWESPGTVPALGIPAAELSMYPGIQVPKYLSSLGGMYQ